MPTFVRTALYLVAATVIWFAEDLLFSRALGFDLAQTAVVTLYFALLLGVALWFIIRTSRRAGDHVPTADGFTVARMVSIAPMLTVIVGSFAALPVIIFVLLARALV